MVLQYQLAYVKHTLHCASERKTKLEELMSRPTAKKWDATKKAKMVRRLVTSTETVEQCVVAVDEVSRKLEEVLAKMTAAQQPHNVAPFIKAPPTSEVPNQLFDTPVPTSSTPAITSPEIESPFGS